MQVKELVKKWKGNKRYTLKVIEAMPEENFTFKIFEGGKTFKSQASHITTWLSTHSRFVTDEEREKPTLKTKEDILTELTQFFDDLIAFLEETAEENLATVVKVWYGEVSREFILQVMDNHLSHHRGQMIIYLRLKGIKAPAYTGW